MSKESPHDEPRTKKRDEAEQAIRTLNAAAKEANAAYARHDAELEALQKLLALYHPEPPDPEIPFSRDHVRRRRATG